ncbi:MAG: hypothetical protein EU535_07650, partial [Promethearchaeota archaeon]
MKQRTKTLFVLFIELLFLFGGCLVIFSSFWFPGNGGFTRNVLFIHSDSSLDSQGYFILVDELSGKAKTQDIDFVLHGRGALSVAGVESATFTTGSYTTNDLISVKTSFLSPITSISQYDGGFYPDFRRGHIYHEDNTTNYIKARYSGEENPVMGSVIYPRNNSDGAHPAPTISAVDWNQFGRIGDNDLIYYQEESNLTTVFDASLNVTTNAKLLFIHQNATDGIDYMYGDDISVLNYNNEFCYLSSDKSTVLVNYHNYTEFISGYVHYPDYISIENKLVHITLPFHESISPFVYINGQEDPSVILNLDDYTGLYWCTIEPTESFSFIISKNPVNEDSRIIESSPKDETDAYPIIHQYPNENAWKISEASLTAATHPYILLNSAELSNLQTKITTNQEPWKSWYDAIISDVDSLAATDISEWDEDARDDVIQPLITKYMIDGGQTYLDKIKEILLDMEAMDSLYEKDLRRSYALQAYSIAYDLIQSTLSSQEREIIEELLYNHALPLTNLQIFSDNNHRCIDAAGLGMTGLVIKNKEFVDLATENVLNYLYDKPRADGGSYEGQSYLAFALHQSIQYMQALTHVGGYNFFEDSKYLACLDFMANSLSPLGTVPLFEDTYLTGDAVEVLLMAAPRITNSSKFENYPHYFQYLFETRQNNSALVGLGTYYYLNGQSANLRRLALYDPNFELNDILPNFHTEIYTNTNMAFLREDYGKNSLYMALSSKNFMQSHPHYDENSFELWGYGAWLIHNPGYPNFGKEGHDYTISTEASNTLLIGGEGQQIPQAKGFTLTITSPYFDIVKADATETYNSPGSWITAWAVNGFVFLSTALIGISGIMLTIRNKTKIDRESHVNSKRVLKIFNTDGENQIPILRSKEPALWETKLGCAKENLINFGVLAAANITYFIFVVIRFEFYMAYSDNPLKIIIPFRAYLYAGLLILPVILVFVFYRGYINGFNRNLHRFIDFAEESEYLRAKTRKIIARNNLVLFPWFIVASIVIGFTVVRGFVEFESIFFETVGGVGETIYYLFGWLQNYALLLGILLIVQIPFNFLMLRRLNSELLQKTSITISTRFLKMKTLVISILIKSVYIIIYFGF